MTNYTRLYEVYNRIKVFFFSVHIQFGLEIITVEIVRKFYSIETISPSPPVGNFSLSCRLNKNFTFRLSHLFSLPLSVLFFICLSLPLFHFVCVSVPCSVATNRYRWHYVAAASRGIIKVNSLSVPFTSPPSMLPLSLLCNTLFSNLTHPTTPI